MSSAEHPTRPGRPVTAPEPVRGEPDNEPQAHRDDPAAQAPAPTPEHSSNRSSGRSSHRSFWAELPVLILVALVLALLLKAFLVQAFFIPSGSMESTLQVGDRVLVNKLVYRIRPITRGDVVVFNGLESFAPEIEVEEPTNAVARVTRRAAAAFGFAPPGERDFIKRVIGIPGDRVRCCDTSGHLTVNGVPLDEPYVYPGDAASDTPFDVVVQPGRLWVMGDHRSRSADSRSHLGDPGGGTVPADKVIGRAFVVVWPFGRADVLDVPATFGQPALAGSVPPAGSPAEPAGGGSGTSRRPVPAYLPVLGWLGAGSLTGLARTGPFRRRSRAG